jgi:hypothetical protein
MHNKKKLLPESYRTVRKTKREEKFCHPHRFMWITDFSDRSMWMTEFTFTYMFWPCVMIGFSNSAVLLVMSKKIYKNIRT